MLIRKNHTLPLTNSNPYSKMINLNLLLYISILTTPEQPGVVIVLNGASSSGKTTIQKAIQKLSKDFFLRVGIDTFFDALIDEPNLSESHTTKKFDQYTPSGEYVRGIEYREDPEGHPVIPLKVGPAGDRIIFGMHRAIAAYASTGNNLIVDYILYKPSWAKDLEESLKNTKVYWVKVNAPLEVIEARERKRNTSPAGHARSHYQTVHDGIVYDLELDTSLQSPEECAIKIISLINTKIYS